MIERKEMVRQLLEASRLLEVLAEDRFRARAYANAARGLEAYEGDLGALAERNELERIAGIGKGLAAELSAEPTDGVLPLLADLRERVPAEVRELFRISGLGPSKVRALWHGGFGSVEALLAGVDAGGVQELKGFGKKSAAAFRDGAQFVLDARSRMRRDEAEAIAEELAQAFAAAIGHGDLVVSGSFRRGMETVDVLDVIVTGIDEAAFDAFTETNLIPRDSAHADPDDAPTARAPNTRAPNGQAVDVAKHGSDLRGSRGRRHGKDVRIVLTSDEAVGATMAVLTGGDAYVAWLRDRAAGAGFSLRADGLFRDGVRLETPSEADVFRAIGVPMPAPELREEPAAEPVEDLIELGDLHGLVHNHSTWSDAEHSMREMVAAARARGFRYLAMADHSRSSYYAGGLTADRVRRQADEIRAIRAELAAEGADFTLLHGIEVDILPDGALDYEDDVLELLDYAVVSVHQQFTLTREAQTERMVRAVQSPYADILGHATGRLLLRRPEYDVDLDAVIEACAQTGTVLEINANPRRLDLDWRWVRVAARRGCAFSIDPDAHHIDGYDDLRYGVAVARKAGLSPASVVNTAPTAEAFLGHLKRAKRQAT